MTSLADIVRFLKKIAPPERALTNRPEGIQIGAETQVEQASTTINRVLVATYPSSRIVTMASQSKANLLVCYRPLFSEPISRLSDKNLIRVRLLSKNYISVYSMSSSLVGAKDGLSDALAKELGLKIDRDFLSKGTKMDTVRAGVICDAPEESNHSGFANNIASRLEISDILFTGNLDAEVTKVIVFAGSRLNKYDIYSAKSEGAPTVITGEVNPEVRRLAHETQVNLYEVPGFATENPGMKQLRHQLSLEFPDLKIEYTESRAITDILRPYSETMA